MKKGEAIDTILIQVNGGTLSQDSNVMRADIAAYLPAAIAAAAKMDAIQKRQEARADATVTGLYSYFPSTEFYSEVVRTPVLDSVTGKYYIEMPDLLDLPNGWNTMGARPVGSFSVDYIRLSNPSSLIGVDYMSQSFFWIIKNGKQLRMYFSTLPFPIQDVAVQAALSPMAQEDDDELNISPGMEDFVIQSAVNFFRGQRTIPADPILDDKDVNDMGMRTKR